MSKLQLRFQYIFKSHALKINKKLITLRKAGYLCKSPCKKQLSAQTNYKLGQAINGCDLQLTDIYYSVMEYVNKFVNPLKFQALDKLESLKFIEQKYQIKPSLVLLILFVVLLLLSPILNTHGILTSIVCYLIPAYLSFIALESTDKEDDIRYLTYWILFSLVQISTPLLKLFFNQFMYMTIRVFITIVLLHPLSNVTGTIYNNYVRPFLSQHEQQIDQELDELAKEGKKKLIKGAEEVITNI